MEDRINYSVKNEQFDCLCGSEQMSTSQGIDPSKVPLHVIQDRPPTRNVTDLVSNRTSTPKKPNFSKAIQSLKSNSAKLMRRREKKSPKDPNTQVNMLETRTYCVSSHICSTKRGALVDRGANGGVAGSDTRIIGQTGRTVVITGIDDHQLDNIPVGTCGAVVPTNNGQLSYSGSSSSTLLCARMR